MSDALISLLTALGDDELIIGHRHSEWTGHAPHIEEDVAFSSIAQDELGHAAAFFRLAAGAGGGDADGLAFGRQPEEYRHAVLCERPNADWAYTLARHWLYDEADDIRLEALSTSADRSLVQLVAKIRREETWHLLHARTWMQRLASGPVEGRLKLSGALADVYSDVAGIFEPFELEKQALQEGTISVSSGELLERFEQRVMAELDRLGIQLDHSEDRGLKAEFVASSSGDLLAAEGGERPSAKRNGQGGRRGRHSEGFAPLWEEMTKTFRTHPGARW